MTTAKRIALPVLLLWAGLCATAVAQAPSGTEGEFSYSPSRLGAGQSVLVSGKCLWAGSGEGTRFHVGISATESQADGTIYGFSKEFRPAANGAVAGDVPVPGSAPAGEYYIFANCAVDDQVFFNKSGPLTIVANSAPRPQPTATTRTATPARPTTLAAPDSTTTVGRFVSSTTVSVATTIGRPDSKDLATARRTIGKPRNDDANRTPAVLVALVGAIGAVGAALVGRGMRRPRAS